MWGQPVSDGTGVLRPQENLAREAEHLCLCVCSVRQVSARYISCNPIQSPLCVQSSEVNDICLTQNHQSQSSMHK